MGIIRCLLLLGLIAGGSATFGRRIQLAQEGKCGLFCGLTTRSYHPARNSGKCFGVFNYLAQGLNVAVDAKLSLVSDIFTAFSNIGVAANINEAVSTCLNLSRGIGLIIDRWIDGLGVIFNNLIIAISRLIFCVLGKQRSTIFTWFTLGRNTSPAVCNKDFGIKWGWRKYLRGYSSYNEIVEYYDLINVRAKVYGLLKGKGMEYSELEGSNKLIVDCILNMASMFQRELNEWERDDYIDCTRFLITISAAVGSAYKADAGVAVVDEYCQYVGPCYEKEFNGYNINEQKTVIIKKVETCDTVSFNGSFRIDSDIQNDTTVTTYNTDE